MAQGFDLGLCGSTLPSKEAVADIPRQRGGISAGNWFANTDREFDARSFTAAKSRARLDVTDHTHRRKCNGPLMRDISQKAFIRHTDNPACKVWDGGGSRLWWTAPVTQKKYSWAVPAVWRLIYNREHPRGLQCRALHADDEQHGHASVRQYVAVMDSRTRPVAFHP